MRREPSRMCSPRRRPASVWSSPSGTNTRGTPSTALLIARVHARSRPSTLAKTLHEYGRLVRTIYLCRYLAGEELRQRHVRGRWDIALPETPLKAPLAS